jgi:hypothetical protein
LEKFGISIFVNFFEPSSRHASSTSRQPIFPAQSRAHPMRRAIHSFLLIILPHLICHLFSIPKTYRQEKSHLFSSIFSSSSPLLSSSFSFDFDFEFERFEFESDLR